MDNEHKPEPGHFFAYESHDGELVTFKLPHDTDLPNVLRAMERYLRATGYIFPEMASLKIEEDKR